MVEWFGRCWVDEGECFGQWALRVAGALWDPFWEVHLHFRLGHLGIVRHLRNDFVQRARCRQWAISFAGRSWKMCTPKRWNCSEGQHTGHGGRWVPNLGQTQVQVGADASADGGSHSNADCGSNSSANKRSHTGSDASAYFGADGGSHSSADCGSNSSANKRSHTGSDASAYFGADGGSHSSADCGSNSSANK